MTIQRIDILDPATGAVVDQCRGTTSTGACPRAGRDGVVACAGRLMAPLKGDPQYWPVWVRPNSRHCSLNWNRSAQFWLRQAEGYRDQWYARLTAEINYVKARAAAGDPRFKRMTPRELEVTGRWRWILSLQARHLVELEQTYRRRAHMYLTFVEFQGRSSPPLP